MAATSNRRVAERTHPPSPVACTVDDSPGRRDGASADRSPCSIQVSQIVAGGQDPLGRLARSHAVVLDEVPHRDQPLDGPVVIEPIARRRSLRRTTPYRRSQTRTVGTRSPLRAAACLIVYMVCAA